MKKFTTFSSRMVALPVDNVDTDQIIPARFLKTISKDGLGDQLFYDWRYDAEGRPKPDFVLNQPAAKEAAILLAGDNFGCGSSREHAPWALAQFGFRAVISTSFADIFRQNALKNSLLPLVVNREVHAELFKLTGEVTVDLAGQKLVLPGGRTIEFAVDSFAKHCMLEGTDELGYILGQEAAITAYESRRPASGNTLSRSSLCPKAQVGKPGQRAPERFRRPPQDRRKPTLPLVFPGLDPCLDSTKIPAAIVASSPKPTRGPNRSSSVPSPGEQMATVSAAIPNAAEIRRQDDAPAGVNRGNSRAPQCACLPPGGLHRKARARRSRRSIGCRS